MKCNESNNLESIMGSVLEMLCVCWFAAGYDNKVVYCFIKLPFSCVLKCKYLLSCMFTSIYS